jgi:hypothetical protein
MSIAGSYREHFCEKELAQTIGLDLDGGAAALAHFDPAHILQADERDQVVVVRSLRER